MANQSNVSLVLLSIVLSICAFGLICCQDAATTAAPENVEEEESGDVECTIWCWLQKALIWMVTNILSRFF
jgi:hypothetical protein